MKMFAWSLSFQLNKDLIEKNMFFKFFLGENFENIRFERLIDGRKNVFSMWTPILFKIQTSYALLDPLVFKIFVKKHMTNMYSLIKYTRNRKKPWKNSWFEKRGKRLKNSTNMHVL